MPNPANELIAKLQKRNALIERALRMSQIVEDVCKRRVLDCHLSYASLPTGSVDARALLAKRQAPEGELKYLPKGNREDPADYRRRIAMTPFFPQVPDILRDRRGALFKNPPVLDSKNPPPKIVEFYESATTDGKPLVQVIAKCEPEMESRGFFGVFIDRPELTPEDRARKEAGQLDQATVELKKLDRPMAIYYPAERILDFHEDALGLVFVKVVDYRYEVLDPLEDARQVHEYRIIHRQNIRVVRAVETKNGWEILDDKTIPHNTVDKETGDRVCPFVIGNSGVDVEDTPIGSSMLIEAAESDVSATRTLSLLLWCLYIVGTPILKRWITRGSQLKGGGEEVNTNPNAYEALLVETSGTGREDMEFCQLDGTGLEMNAAMWEHFRKIGREQANKKSGDATQQPSEKSGVAIAWEFWTDEARMLYHIANQLEAAFNRVLDIVCMMTGDDPKSVNLKFNKEFDVQDDAKNLDVAEKVIEMAERMNLPATLKLAMRKVVKSLGKIPETEWESIEKEINAIAAVKPKPEPGADPEGETGAIQADHVALSLQQLGLAAERAKGQGNNALASKLQKKMDELVEQI